MMKILERLVERYKSFIMKRETKRELERLTDRELIDIGIDPLTISRKNKNLLNIYSQGY